MPSVSVCGNLKGLMFGFSEEEESSAEIKCRRQEKGEMQKRGQGDIGDNLQVKVRRSGTGRVSRDHNELLSDGRSIAIVTVRCILTQDLDLDIAGVLFALLVHGSTHIHSLIQLPTRGRDY